MAAPLSSETVPRMLPPVLWGFARPAPNSQAKKSKARNSRVPARASNQVRELEQTVGVMGMLLFWDWSNDPPERNLAVTETLELVAQRKLHDAWIGKQSGVVPKCVANVEGSCGLLDIKAVGIRHVEDFPTKLQ